MGTWFYCIKISITKFQGAAKTNKEEKILIIYSQTEQLSSCTVAPSRADCQPTLYIYIYVYSVYTKPISPLTTPFFFKIGL